MNRAVLSKITKKKPLSLRFQGKVYFRMKFLHMQKKPHQNMIYIMLLYKINV